MSDVRRFPAERDRFSRWVQDALARFEAELHADGKGLHPMAKAGIQERLSELARDAEREFGRGPLVVSFPEAFHTLPDSDREAIIAAVGEKMAAEAQRAFRWYATRYLQLTMTLEAERIKRHSGA